MKARTGWIEIPQGKRIICISDIHGNLRLFKRLLDTVSYTADDVLILLGDLYTKGLQGLETLRFIIELSKNPGVHALRGNCDWIENSLTDAEKSWLEGLPHIIASQDYRFVHGGLASEDLGAQEAMSCMKNDAFMEKGLRFQQYVVVGHWPTMNYARGVLCCNPIVDPNSRIICIDGGNVVKEVGQLNAFMIQDGVFSFDFVDDLPQIVVQKSQPSGGGAQAITWNNRHIEILQRGAEFSRVKILSSGEDMPLPSSYIWVDGDGRLCGRDGTDYELAVRAGDIVSLIDRFGDRVLVKKGGVLGWINL